MKDLEFLLIEFKLVKQSGGGIWDKSAIILFLNILTLKKVHYKYLKKNVEIKNYPNNCEYNIKREIECWPWR